MSTLWWKFQLWLMGVPDKLRALSKKEQESIPEEIREKRKRLAKPVYIGCGIVLFLCAIFWILTSGVSPVIQ